MTGGHNDDARQLDRPDRVDALIDFLTPAVEDVLRRLEGDEFTTGEFVEVFLSDPPAATAYAEALRRWGEGERYAKMVVHGQVIPAAMRRTGLVEWVGFAYGEEDEYAVPARWQLRAAGGDAGTGSPGGDGL